MGELEIEVLVQISVEGVMQEMEEAMAEVALLYETEPMEAEVEVLEPLKRQDASAE